LGCRGRVFNWQTGEERLDLGPRYVIEAAFSPGKMAGRYLAVLVGVTHDRQSTEIFDLTSGEMVATIPETSTLSIAFDPTGSLLAGGNANGHAWVVDLEELVAGRPLAESWRYNALAHDDPIWDVALNEAGVLATFSTSETRLWDITTGEMIGSPVGAGAGVFAPGGDQLLYSDDAFLRRYFLDEDALIDVALTKAVRSMSPEECARYHPPSCDGP
jgi:WD40 repeat protein